MNRHTRFQAASDTVDAASAGIGYNSDRDSHRPSTRGRTVLQQLPLRFPQPADVVFRDAKRFRRQTSAERFLMILDLLASGERLLTDSPRREQAQKLRAEDERQWRMSHRELFMKHGF
jgi:hypothetical protein